MGCEFAIDDFGTGFSSFSHIKHLPYGLIKIDGEFVRGVSESSQDRAVVEAIVHLARPDPSVRGRDVAPPCET